MGWSPPDALKAHPAAVNMAIDGKVELLQLQSGGKSGAAKQTKRTFKTFSEAVKHRQSQQSE